MMNNIWNFVSGSNPPSNPNSPSAISRGRSLTPGIQSRKPDYSLSYLQSQIDELISIAGNAESPKSSLATSSTDRLVEVIRAIAETLLWGEQNEEDSQMFDYFCEKGVMKIFAALLNSPTIPPSSGIFSASSAGNRQIKIQLLQTMSLLLLNVKRQTSLYFLFSNNAVNQLINNNNHLDFSDEEILSYYVSLIKSISLRMSGESIQFFINDKNPNYFPLFSQSIRFFDHHDRMVRIAVRTITLSIFKLYDTNKVLEKFINENSGGYFSLLACQLRDLWFLMDRTVNPPDKNDNQSIESPLSVISDEMIDQLEYLAEIHGLNISTLSDMMWSKMEAYAIDGVLLKGILGIPDGGESPRLDEEMRAALPATTKISQHLSLFIFAQFLEVFKTTSPTDSLVLKFLKCDDFTKSKVESDIKKINGVTFSCLVAVFVKLLQLSESSLPLTTALSDFGILPPRSIELTILLAQSLAKSFEQMSFKQVQLTVFFLGIFLEQNSIDETFKRPVKLTIIDSFKVVSTKISQMLTDRLIRPLPKLNETNPKPVSNSNLIDHGVIDLFETVLNEFKETKAITLSHPTGEHIFRTISDPCLINPFVKSEHWSIPNEPPKEIDVVMLRKFFTLTVFVERVVHNEILNPEIFLESLFASSNHQPDELGNINSPSTPPPELIESESIATDLKAGPIPENLVQGDSVDLGRRDRIVCTHLTSPNGRSTRYLLVDKTRVILVAPDLTKPGFATVKFIEQLRKFCSISIYRDDQRILVIEAPNGTVEQLGFDDMKRCHLALMHLESKRIEIRKQIYKNIQTFLSKFIHYI